ncbi:hypothetical protein HKO22_00790 [Peptoniphilus sp. AGMB00490]|uniref:Uncharacterized protein n=2 Tax=Peptoniphilus TaxID=162289 RepID=A0ACD6AYT7_9FIRM|nr:MULTISPECIES: DUF2007 domain-containing protein [Peptoniphilus]NMW84278.1 hypothetical protein [Peptoniphilus faecalis]OLR64313.1 hypothetical protein BIV18_01505 [Peptoniphilus porci]
MKKDIEYVKLVTSTNKLLFDEICAFLEDNSIPYFVKDEGDYMRLISGFSLYEKGIYVSENDFDTANELLIYFMNDNDDNDDLIFD